MRHFDNIQSAMSMNDKKESVKLRISRESREIVECAHDISLMVDLLDGRLADDGRDKLSAQLDYCADCREKFEELARARERAGEEMDKPVSVFGDGSDPEKRKSEWDIRSVELSIRVSKQLYRMMGGSPSELSRYFDRHGIPVVEAQRVRYDAETDELTLRVSGVAGACRLEALLRTLEDYLRWCERH